MKDIFVIEWLKIKNAKIWWLVVLAPAFMVIQGVSNLLRYYDLFTGKGQNVWLQLYHQSIIFYVMILLPLLISLVMFFLARIENAHQGWNYYLSLPVHKSQIYVVKFVIACGLILVNILAFITSMVIAGVLIGAPGQIPFQTLFFRPLAAYGAALPIMAFLYVLSMRFSQLTVPLALGIGCALPAMLVANTRFWLFYPWTYPIMAALGAQFDNFNKGAMVYLISFVVLIVIFGWGYREFLKSDIR